MLPEKKSYSYLCISRVMYEIVTRKADVMKEDYL